MPEKSIPEQVKERWQEIDERGISLIEKLFELFTPFDDYFRQLLDILQEIDRKLSALSGLPTRPTRPVTPTPIEIKIPTPTGEEIDVNAVIEALVTSLFNKYKELIELGELTAMPLNIGAPSFITYPSEGGTKSIDTAGNVTVDFSLGKVTLPDNTTDSISSLTSIGADYISSIILYVSKDSVLEIESGQRLSLPAGQAVPFENLELKKFKVVVPANTDFKFIASSTPLSIPTLLDIKTQEFYTDQYRKAVNVDTAGTSVDISPPVKQVLIYVTGDDMYVEFNGPIDSDSSIIPKDGSISYPFLTTSIALKAVSGSGVAYIRGLR